MFVLVIPRPNKIVHSTGYKLDLFFSTTKLMLSVTEWTTDQGLVVQSILSLTNLFRGQLVKSFMTLLSNTLSFFVEKMREAFALQKLLTFFPHKIFANFRYQCWKF